MDERQKFQPIDGFGYALTGGSAQHLIRMRPATAPAILKELFATGEREHRRQLLAAHDRRVRLERARLHLRRHCPTGETDPEMRHFDLGPDRADVIPVMKEILKLNPEDQNSGLAVDRALVDEDQQQREGRGS